MDIIYLPLLTSETAPAIALASMEWLEKSALVRQQAVEFQLLEAGDVVYALAHRFLHLADVTSLKSVHKITTADVAQWGLDVKDPRGTKQKRDKYERFLDQKGVNYAVLNTVPGVAQVVSRHEGGVINYKAAPKRCYCEGPNKHGYPPPAKKQGARCRLCTHIVNCV